MMTAVPLPQQSRPESEIAPVYNAQSASLGDPESEIALLGYIMFHGEADQPNPEFEKVSSLTPEHFVNIRNQYVWRAMRRLATRGEPIEIGTVENELKSVSVGSATNYWDAVGKLYLHEMLRERGKSLVAYQRLMECCENRRSWLGVVHKMTKLITDGSKRPEELNMNIMTVVNEAYEKAIALSGNQPTSLKEGIERFNETFMEDTDAAGGAGWSMGFREFDEVFRGFQKGRLYLVGGLPGDGKSTLVQNFGMAMLNAGARVYTLSLELMIDEIIFRIISAESCIEMYRIKEKRMNAEEVERFNASLMRLADHRGANSFYLKYESRPTLSKIRNLLLQIHRTSGLDAFILDYPGTELIAPENPKANFDRSQHMGDIIDFLKDIAKELNIPVIAPVQTKAAQQKTGGKPQLTDIEWSHNAGKRADVVIMLQKETPFSKALGYGCTIAHIVKHRMGEGEGREIKLESRLNFFTFSDWRS